MQGAETKVSEGHLFKLQLLGPENGAETPEGIPAQPGAHGLTLGTHPREAKQKEAHTPRPLANFPPSFLTFKRTARPRCGQPVSRSLLRRVCMYLSFCVFAYL